LPVDEAIFVQELERRRVALNHASGARRLRVGDAPFA